MTELSPPPLPSIFDDDDAFPRPVLRSLSGFAYEPGSLVAGKYRLLEVLGEGGMGAVFRAHNEALDVPVALKLIRGSVTSPIARKRFLREARATARIEHPAIVRVFDYGETEHGDPYLVMELLKGRSLGAELEEHGRLPATEAVRLLLPVISALDAVHSKGVVHRDLKPDNVMLLQEEARLWPKLLDFGVAKVLDPLGVEAQVTMAGTIVGSPEYMSPEQARARPDVDERCDVWAVSVLLYEAMTGKRPFDGPNYNAILSAVVEGDPEPTNALGAGDADLWQILARGLEKDRDLRWQSMRDLGEALAQWALARGIETDVTGLPLGTRWRASSPDLSTSSLTLARLTSPETLPDVPAPAARWRLRLATAFGLLALLAVAFVALRH